MAGPVWLTLSGEEELGDGASGEDSISSMSIAEHEDQILILEIEQNIHLPTDPQSGHPTGAPISDGIILTKLFDASSPLLMESMAKGVVFDEAELQYFRTSPEGEQEHYFTQTMENVVISNIVTFMPQCLDPANAKYTHMEKVTLQYSASTWTHEVAGTEGGFNIGLFPFED